MGMQHTAIHCNTLQHAATHCHSTHERASRFQQVCRHLFHAAQSTHTHTHTYTHTHTSSLLLLLHLSSLSRMWKARTFSLCPPSYPPSPPPFLFPFKLTRTCSSGPFGQARWYGCSGGWAGGREIYSQTDTHDLCAARGTHTHAHAESV